MERTAVAVTVTPANDAPVAKNLNSSVTEDGQVKLTLSGTDIETPAAALIFTSGLSTPGGYNFGNLNVLDPQSPWSPLRPATTLSVYI